MRSSAVSRVVGGLGAVVCGGIALIEAAGIIGGLTHDAGNGQVETSTIVFVQGLVGLPALAMALLATYRSIRTAAGTAPDGARSGSVTVLFVCGLAVVLFALWATTFVMAYGS